MSGRNFSLKSFLCLFLSKNLTWKSHIFCYYSLLQIYSSEQFMIENCRVGEFMYKGWKKWNISHETINPHKAMLGESEMNILSIISYFSVLDFLSKTIYNRLHEWIYK